MKSSTGTRKHTRVSPKSDGRRRVRRLLYVSLAILAVIGLLNSNRVLRQYRLDKVRHLIAQHRLPAAADLANTIAKQDPTFAEAQFLLARIFRKTGQIDQARLHLLRAKELGYSEELIELERALTLAQAGQLSHVEDQLRRSAAELAGENREICEALVNGYLRNYRFEDAATWLEAWQADYKSDPQPYVSRGIMWQHLRLWKEASAEFEQALRLDPSRMDVRQMQGDALVQLHRYDEAAEQFEACILVDPQDQEALLGLSTCRQSQGDLTGAKTLLEKIVAADPTNVEAQYGLGQIALSEGNVATAVQWLRKAYQEHPRHLGVRYAFATALQSAGKTDEAKPHFAFVDKANAAFEKVQEMTREVQLHPEQIAPRYEVGKILLEYGSPDEGTSWLYSVLELDPKHRETHLALAAHFEQQGNERSAAHHRQLAEMNDLNDRGA